VEPILQEQHAHGGASLPLSVLEREPRRRELTLFSLSRPQEVHILHDYPSDFYGKELRVVMLGFIRPEYNYSSLGASSSFPALERACSGSCLREGVVLGDLALPHTAQRFRGLADSTPALADALIKDINHDKLVALNSVAPSRAPYASYHDDAFFFTPSTLPPPADDPTKPRVKPSEHEAQA